MIVYQITCTVTGKSYIGMTTRGLNRRWSEHKRQALRGSHKLIHKAIIKYGIDNFVMVPVYEGVSRDELCNAERALIAELGTLVPNGYNLTIGGDGTGGFRRSAESNRKLSMSKMGTKQSPSHVENNRRAQTGRRHKPETIEKMRAGRRAGTHNSRQITVCGVEFQSMRAFGIRVGVTTLCVKKWVDAGKTARMERALLESGERAA